MTDQRIINDAGDPANPKELARMTLFALQDHLTVARLNRGQIRELLAQSELELMEPRLVLVPLEEHDDGVGIGGSLLVPRLLLEGGPALDAQRRSVRDHA